MPARRTTSFLRGFSPGLVALRDDGNVVLEVKRRDELKGSNDLVALARVIAEQSGWRLDLIHLPSLGLAAVGADKANLDRLMERSLTVRKAGLEDAALIYALSVLEGLSAILGRNTASVWTSSRHGRSCGIWRSMGWWMMWRSMCSIVPGISGTGSCAGWTRLRVAKLGRCWN